MLLFIGCYCTYNVSVNSKPDHPSPGQTPEEFFERANASPTGQKESAKPRPLGQQNRAKTQPRGNYFQKSSKKKPKHETEIMKNNTEMLICLEILKQ